MRIRQESKGLLIRVIHLIWSEFYWVSPAERLVHSKGGAQFQAYFPPSSAAFRSGQGSSIHQDTPGRGAERCGDTKALACVVAQRITVLLDYFNPSMKGQIDRSWEVIWQTVRSGALSFIYGKLGVFFRLFIENISHEVSVYLSMIGAKKS